MQNDIKDILIEDAMTAANKYGRRFYRGSIVRIERYESEKEIALQRLRRSRSEIVREAANRLVAFNGGYRYYRYLNAAPMREIELLAQHGCIKAKGGAA
jgi:hypothetical protein